MPFKRYLALQNIPLSKQPFKTQPQIENEDIVIWSPQYNLPTTRTNKCRALSLQKVVLDGWSLILHIVLETCTIFMHKFDMRFVFHLYILRLTSWIWTNPTIEGLKFDIPSKWNSYEDFNLQHRLVWIASSNKPFGEVWIIKCLPMK